jgi:hypothetical protein
MSQIKPMGKITQFIDLFVDMCFDDINSKARISQFRMLGIQLGFSELETNDVVKMGKSEYTKMLDEINKTMIQPGLI